jgi:hypothetical protein
MKKAMHEKRNFETRPLGGRPTILAPVSKQKIQAPLLNVCRTDNMVKNRFVSNLEIKVLPARKEALNAYQISKATLYHSRVLMEYIDRLSALRDWITNIDIVSPSSLTRHLPQPTHAITSHHSPPHPIYCVDTDSLTPLRYQVQSNLF